MRAPASALFVLAGLLSACAEPETQNLPPIPAAFQGRWGLSAEDCVRAADQTGDWLFVTGRSVGGYDHMYELAELALDGENAYFVTGRGGPSGHMKLVNQNTLRVQYVGEDVVDLTLCSKDTDR